MITIKVCDFVLDCRSGEDERTCGNCTFDNASTGQCGWHDVSQGATMWERGSNTTLGPPVDHTTYSSTGYYMYLARNNGTSYNSPARLLTPVIQQASSTCLFEFWIYIQGMTSNQLNATLLTGNQIYRATLQRFHYISMSNWTKVELEIGRVDVPFQIALDSNPAYYGAAIAIDDTKLVHCQLPTIVNPNQCQTADKYLCSRGSCIPKSRTCDMTDDCGDHSDELRTLCASYRTCTFDVSFCDWRHDNTTEFQWVLHQGVSPSDDTGVCLLIFIKIHFYCFCFSLSLFTQIAKS